MSTPTTRRPPWRPLLAGDAAESARVAVGEIAAALDRIEVRDASLMAGTAGLALWFDYLDKAGSLPGARDRAEHFLAQAIDAACEDDLPPGLHAGLAGVGFAAEHLGRGDLIDPEPDDSESASIDEVVHACVTQSPGTGEYDLVYGLAGLGVYALERLPRALARTSLERIVDRLAETATHSAAGVAWHTGPERLEEARAELPGGYEDLGLAHGVPGVIALLGRILAAGIAVDTARPLLTGAVAWLLAQKGTCAGSSLFPTWVAEGHVPSASRAAWCYGDPGVAAALFVAARGAGEPAWEAEALSIARASATRAPETALVKDAGICHGAAGLGHIYNRLFQATGDHVLGEAAARWLAYALAHRRLGADVAGFPAWKPAFRGAPARWDAEPGLLVGAAGVAIVLAAATSSIEPAWDRVFLLSGSTGSDREGP